MSDFPPETPSPESRRPGPSGNGLVHIVDDVPELDHRVDGAAGSLPLVVAMSGFLDAGQASELAAAHLQDEGGERVVAAFDIDTLYDYRARRPPVTFAQDHYAAYDAPRLNVRLCRDASGAPYLLMRGPEPDNRWEAFARAVLDVVNRFGVTRVVSLGAIPMAVPHTRPIAVTPHANRPGLITTKSPWRSELRVPASAQTLVEIRMGEWGTDALGYVVHVPHYLAQMAYPVAAVTLLEQLEIGAHLSLDLDALRESAAETEIEITRYLGAHEEVQEIVTSLEQQYDAFQRAETEGSSLLATDEPLPSAEDLGRQFEQFLAELDGPDTQEG